MAGQIMKHIFIQRSRMPTTIEVCNRDLDGLPCRGVVYRHVQGAYCPKCGATEGGITYVIRATPIFSGRQRMHAKKS